ncbi:DUF6387 family protein [Nitrosococcus wardiae]|uniref:Uncharacterized protein n=1 Tax=Nitrosococcus wardiae TaxID=1814290 RepID=A0A4P7BY55_9GAMM|nr:DUF6387 family protein [Nitrosococcus wardiae]QBQ53372.1 hypothetical protein E3U44_01760 [Nitrosococcus wardiae]
MRKTTRLKKKEDLPEWFELAKYEGVSELDTAGWYYQLSIRRNIYDNPISVHASDEEKRDSRYQSFLYALEAITQYGLFPSPDFSDSERLALFLLLQGCGSPSVRPLTCAGISMASWTIEQRPKMGLIKAAQTAYDSPSQLSLGGPAHITVDLRATDKQLKDDFEKWLRDCRREVERQARKRKFSETNFRDWACYQVLPCIDLLLWERYQGVQYTNSLLADSLFPDEVASDEKIRKTVKPTVNELLDLSTIAALGLQAQRSIDKPVKNRNEKS